MTLTVRPLAPHLRLALAAVRRLPAARYRACQELERFLPPRFQAPLAIELGGLSFVCHRADIVARVALAGWWEPAITLLVRSALGLADNVTRNALTWVSPRSVAVGAANARRVLVGFEENAGPRARRPGA